MRSFETITVMNTIGQWVDAFNNNALAASDHTWYLGEMLYNGILYTGLESIGGVKIKSLTNTAINHVSPQNLELDNFYLYFRSINKVLLVDQVTFDLRPYCDGHPHFFYINSDLGFRVSQEFKQQEDEVMLFRFAISTGEIFTQLYVTAQRFGSNVYDTADEFYQVRGCVPLPHQKLQMKLGDGTIKRSGIRFDNHQMPDLLTIEDKPVPYNLRYITVANKVDYTKAVTKNIIPGKKLNYKTQVLSNVASGKFTIQRILLDIYDNCLVIQYGDSEFSDMETALTSINNVSYPFPYDNLVYIPMGIMIIKQNCTDLSDVNQCMLIQQLNTTINPQDSVFFAEDSYARGRLDVLMNDLEDLQKQIDQANKRMNGIDSRIDGVDSRIDGIDTRIDGVDSRIDGVVGTANNHYTNYNNPHKVNKTQVGLGNVENKNVETIKNELLESGSFVKTDNTAQTVQGDKTFSGSLLVGTSGVFRIGGRRLYLGGTPSGMQAGDFWLPDS